MRISPEQFAAQGRQQRQHPEPGRWLLSLIVALVAATLASLTAAFVVALGATLIGLDGRPVEIVGPLVIVGVFATVAALIWRGIRSRWHRMPPGGETHWGPR